MLKGRSATRLGAAVAVGASLWLVAAAGATVTPTSDAPTLAAAMDVPVVAGNPATLPTTTPAGTTPLGVGTTPVPPFPRSPSTFAVLTTGNATQADIPGGDDSSDDGGGLVTSPNRGDTALDVSTLQIPFTVPAGGPNCVSFDFRFLSEEYPVYIHSQFNDAFLAELDATTWTTAGATISGLENNFATDATGQPVTIKSTGPTSMSPAEAAGTPYGGATAPLQARRDVTPGPHTLFLSIFDQSDNILDTTVFVDNFRIFTAPGGCARGSVGLGPAVSITGPLGGSTVQSATPTITGTANGPGNVTVRVYQGEIAAGAPVQELNAARSGTSWSATTAPLPDGQYTAQATQPGADGINGLSGTTTFTVDTSQVQSAPSQAPSDRDGDGIPDSQDTNDGSRPPVPGKSVQVRVVSGDVYVKLPKGASARALGPPKGFVPLKGAANIPVGSQLDTEDGRIALTSAADTGGAKTQTSDFYQGIFQVKQTVPKKKPKKPQQLITDLVLKGQLPSSQCGPIKGARAAGEAAKKKKKGPKSVLGQLWGDGKGKFRTSGKYSSATVRGTIWLTQDRCDGTLTKVSRGTVQVRDFKRKKTVTVKAGHSYLARAARAASKSARKK